MNQNFQFRQPTIAPCTKITTTTRFTCGHNRATMYRESHNHTNLPCPFYMLNQQEVMIASTGCGEYNSPLCMMGVSGQPGAAYDGGFHRALEMLQQAGHHRSIMSELFQSGRGEHQPETLRSGGLGMQHRLARQPGLHHPGQRQSGLRGQRHPGLRQTGAGQSYQSGAPQPGLRQQSAEQLYQSGPSQSRPSQLRLSGEGGRLVFSPVQFGPLTFSYPTGFTLQ